MNRNSLTSNQVRSVVSRYKKGEGAASIAADFDVSVTTILNTLRRQDVTIRPRGRPVTSA